MIARLDPIQPTPQSAYPGHHHPPGQESQEKVQPMPTQDQETYQPSDAARMLNISRASLRRYADEFAPMLPDFSARPSAERQLSALDVGMIAAILAERDKMPDGATRSQLYARLTGPDAPQLTPLTIAEIAQAKTRPGPDAPMAPTTHQDGPTPTPRPLALIDTLAPFQALQSTVDNLTQAINTAAAQAQEREARQAAAQLRADYIRLALLAVLIVAVAVAVAVLVATR